MSKPDPSPVADLEDRMVIVFAVAVGVAAAVAEKR